MLLGALPAEADACWLHALLRDRNRGPNDSARAGSLPARHLDTAIARHARLRSELSGDRLTLTKELEIYATPQPPSDYSMQTEVDGLDRFADENALEEFHLYGYSAGASIALAYVTQRPRRVMSVALNEPATDFTDDDRQAIAADLLADLVDLPVPERMARFARGAVRPGVEPPPPPPPGDDPEMAKRPAGLGAFSRVVDEYCLDRAALRAFDRPVYYSYGSLSNERWETMGERFERDLPRCRIERYDGLHHLHSSDMAEPGRVAASLELLWNNAESGK